jgi:hypothetical protein
MLSDQQSDFPSPCCLCSVKQTSRFRLHVREKIYPFILGRERNVVKDRRLGAKQVPYTHSRIATSASPHNCLRNRWWSFQSELDTVAQRARVWEQVQLCIRTHSAAPLTRVLATATLGRLHRRGVFTPSSDRDQQFPTHRRHGHKRSNRSGPPILFALASLCRTRRI